MRHFLLFLFWLGVGTAYVSAACSILLWRRRSELYQFFVTSQRSWFPTHFWLLPFIGWCATFAAPVWLSISLYLLALCVGTFVGVIVMLQQQLVGLQRQQTYLESLKGGQVERLRVPLWCAVQRVMGHGNPVSWLTPSVTPDRLKWS